MLKKLSCFVFSFLVFVALVSCQTTTSSNKMTVTFDSNGGSEIEAIELEEEGTIAKPLDPEREGYEFAGWFLDEELFDFDNYVVSESITLDAHWTEIGVAKTYVVKFYLSGGELETTQIEFTDYNEVELPTPTKEGYDFLGWYSGSTKIERLTENKHYVLTAKWEVATVKYTVSLNVNGGEVEVESIQFVEDEEVELPTPTKEGYDFLGWYENEVLVSTIDENRDYVLVAKWEVHVVVPTTYTITFRANGGEVSVESIQFTDFSEVTLPTATRENYDFLGWYESGELVEEITENRNYALVAKWQGHTKTISYELNGGRFEGTYPTTFVIGVSTTLVSPVREGYRFLGWYKTSSLTGSSMTRLPASTNTDVTLYAKWEEKPATVTYVLNGGNWKYSTREEMVEDFLADAMAWGGTTRKPDGMVQGAGLTQVGFANVFGSQFYGFFSDARYQAKWAWLKDYIINVTTVANSKSNLQSGSEPFWRYSVGAFIFEEHRSSYPVSEDYTKDTNANGFWDTLSSFEQSEFEGKGATKTPIRIYYVFDGWYDNPEFTGSPVTEITKDVTLYAKWVEEIPVDSISITNKTDAIDRFGTYQLTWVLNPNNAAIKAVEFESNNPEVATVDENGVITALQNGHVTITIRSLSPSKVTDSVTLYVSSPAHFDVGYDTESYLVVNEEVKLNATYINRDGTIPALIWESMTPQVATVDANGMVTGVSEGEAIIRVSVEGNADLYFEFVLTVLTKELAAELQLVLDGHESNVFTRYDLGIGAGTPVYYADILGSVNDMIFNYDIVYNTKYLAATMANGSWSSGLNTVEFITVHYTAGMTKGSNGEATARFLSTSTGASAHFCTGNDGIFQCLDLDVKGWHAGDGTTSTFTWNPTGVKYNANDPQWPVWGISQNSYFTINGQETSIKTPEKTQNGNLGYVTDDKWLNDQGFAFKVVNGEYYMGTTWWCYSNVWEGRICSRGGNKHSIGIESAVDFGSDPRRGYHPQ